jgi:hypothetical protein
MKMRNEYGKDVGGNLIIIVSREAGIEKSLNEDMVASLSMVVRQRISDIQMDGSSLQRL